MGGEGPERRRIAVVTGSRAEFGLLRPVMEAVRGHAGLELLVIAAGSHLVAQTYREVKGAFEIADAVPMQVAGRTGRSEDAQAVGAGVSRFDRAFARLGPDWVVVLGDRIEAFAAAAAASIGGRALAHIHAGDRAEGIADEGMRHAISKLAHLHLAATEESAQRLVKMGERPELVHNVGSPAIDGLERLGPLDDAEYERLGGPELVFLMHPIGRTEEAEEHSAAGVLRAMRSTGRAVLALHPNLDPGREGIVRAIEGAGVRAVAHLPRERFVGLLRRIAEAGGALVGNSSAGLIEGAALGVAAVDIGPRQGGRERAGNVVACRGEGEEDVARALSAGAPPEPRGAAGHPYGDGKAGERIAGLLARVSPHDPALLRKRCTY